jgi:aminopeptidase 2
LALGDLVHRHIPLGLLTVGKDGKSTADKSIILSDKEVELPVEAGALWKLNAGTTGVFRVAYDAKHLDALGAEASKKHSALSPEDRCVGVLSNARGAAPACLSGNQPRARR